MDLEKFTERARAFLQNAQGLAQRAGHQRLTPEHILKVLLDDEEGLAAGLIKRGGGDPGKALAATEATLKKLPGVQGGGAGQLYMAPETARVLDEARAKLLDQGLLVDSTPGFGDLGSDEDLYGDGPEGESKPGAKKRKGKKKKL